MEQEKNNKSLIAVLIIIIIILAVLCILFATNTISFKSNSIDNNNQSNGNVTDNNTTEDTTNNNTSNDNQVSSSWVNYLLSRHILEAKVTRVRSKDLGDAEDYNKTVTITMDDVKEILSKLENSKLSKIWSEGRGGPDKDHLTIAYENNNQKYEFEIYYGTIDVDKLDDEFKTLLENSKYEEKNTEYKNSQGAFYFYSISDYTDTIFDKYFN